MKKLLANEEQLSQIAAKWTLDIIDDGYQLSRLVTKEEVAAKSKK